MESLQHICRLDSHGSHLWVPDLEMSQIHLLGLGGTSILALEIANGWNSFLYRCFKNVERGILVLPCLSVQPSVHPSLCLWIETCPLCIPIILARSISFLPEASFGLRVLSLPASFCVSVRPCVNHELVRAITHHSLKLGSPNLDHRCKRPWFRSLVFLGVIVFDLQGQI